MAPVLGREPPANLYAWSKVRLEPRYGQTHEPCERRLIILGRTWKAVLGIKFGLKPRCPWLAPFACSYLLSESETRAVRPKC